MNYPKRIDYDLNCGDPTYAQKVISVGLEADGFLTVKRTQKLGEMDSLMFHFTDKAKPYLSPTTLGNQESNLQRVKMADQDLVEVKGINKGMSEKDVVVEYKTVYKNRTA